MKSIRWAMIGLAVFGTTAVFAFAQMGDRESSTNRAADYGDEYGTESQDAGSAQDFRWTGRVADGEALEIKGVNGSITVGPARGSEVEIVAQARGRKSDPDDVRIEMVEHDGGLTVCAVYPTPNGSRENYCGVGSEGRMNTQNNDVQVHFEIRVPDGVDFIGRTVNGGVEALDLGSDVTATTVNGDIDISTRGFAQAETVNGSIDASMESRDFRRGAEFSTVNGSITLDLPDDVDATIDASWLNGSFESDLPFRVDGRLGRRSAQGALGAGGPELELNTVNGSIRIR